MDNRKRKLLEKRNHEKNGLKIIYLDIDGVLNCETAYKDGECQYVKHNDLPDGEHRIKNYHQSFYSKSKYWLNRLIKETGAKVVVSSTWRSSGIDWLREVWKHEEMEGEIIDVTPNFRRIGLDEERYTIPRGCEIDYHLKNVLNFSHINWCKDTQQEYMDKSGVDNYIIIDDDADMLFKQRNHFVHVLPSPRNKDGFGEEHYKLGKELLNRTVIDLNYHDC